MRATRGVETPRVTDCSLGPGTIPGGGAIYAEELKGAVFAGPGDRRGGGGGSAPIGREMTETVVPAAPGTLSAVRAAPAVTAGRGVGIVAAPPRTPDVPPTASEDHNHRQDYKDNFKFAAGFPHRILPVFMVRKAFTMAASGAAFLATTGFTAGVAVAGASLMGVKALGFASAPFLAATAGAAVATIVYKLGMQWLRTGIDDQINARLEMRKTSSDDPGPMYEQMKGVRNFVAWMLKVPKGALVELDANIDSRRLAREAHKKFNDELKKLPPRVA